MHVDTLLEKVEEITDDFGLTFTSICAMVPYASLAASRRNNIGLILNEVNSKLSKPNLSTYVGLGAGVLGLMIQTVAYANSCLHGYPEVLLYPIGSNLLFKSADVISELYQKSQTLKEARRVVNNSPRLID